MIFTIANFVTVFRLGLFAWFVVLISQGQVAMGAIVFFVVWALDVVDGFLARKLGQTSVAGSWFDKISDRIILIGAFIALLVFDVAPWWLVFIFLKDIGLFFVLVFQAPEKRQIDMGIPGKIATFLQGISLLWIMLQWPYLAVLVAITAAFGAWVALRRTVDKSK